MGRKFQRFSEPSHSHTIGHTLGTEYTITATEFFLAVKTLKAGKDAGCNEIRPEMHKALKRDGVFWLNPVCEVAWCSGKASG